jgi:hypothetical protein
VDADDRILVTDRLNSRLQRCDAFGNCSAFAGAGSAPGQVLEASGVATAAGRRLIVADTLNHRIQVWQRCAPTNRIFIGGFEE